MDTSVLVAEVDTKGGEVYLTLLETYCRSPVKFLPIVFLLTALSGCDNKVATIQPPPPGTLHCFAPDGSVLVVAPENGTHGASGNVITWSQGGQLHFTSLPCVGTLKGS